MMRLDESGRLVPVLSTAFVWLGVSLALACGQSESAAPSAAGGTSGGGASGVSQPGAQDFGLFREVLARGELPSPALIDDLGFFAEHKLDYPEPTCSGNMCLHGLVGVMGNFMSGVDCTLLQVGLNSPLDAANLPTRPLHAVLVVDTSGSMVGDPIDYLIEGLLRLVDSLDSTAAISLVRYGDHASVVLEHAAVTDRAALHAAIVGLETGGWTNLSAGLFEGYRLAAAYADPSVETRVLLMSDGVANQGILADPALFAMAREQARLGVGLSTIGAGEAFEVELMRGLAEAGAGTFYFLEDPRAMVEVFEDELSTALTPVALDVRIEADIDAGYALGAAYGTRGFRRDGPDGVVELPAMFLATRRSSTEPVDSGRRGGGGAILFELLRRRGVELQPRVGTLKLTYRDAFTGQTHEQSVTLEVPPEVGGEVIPEDGWFSSFTVEKSFVMLNLLVAFRQAAELALAADGASADALLTLVRAQVSDWLARNEDADIASDLDTLDRFVTVIRSFTFTPQPYFVPPEPWPYD